MTPSTPSTALPSAPSSATRRARRTRPAVIAAAALAVAGLSACSATNPLQTAEAYSAADGVGTTLGDVRAVNLLVITAAEGEPGVLIGGLANDGSSDTEVTLTVDGTQSTVEVPADGVVTFGGDDGESFEIDSVGAAPGALTTLTIATGSAGSDELEVPVLDGTLPEYADLVPAAG
ncbi:hypothetical protein ACTHAM_002206 [Cellulomonas soli]|uniref:hypothetical protein n=1 Tax=Cellulomonas soli TaxID=931535 RepID=UPI003F84916C